MKKIIALAAVLGIAASSFGQGQINFVNAAAALISAGGSPVLPGTNAANRYVFGLFVAPSGTAAPSTLTDPNWQFVGAYATNLTSAGGSGRITAGASASSAPVSIVGFGSGSTVNYIVRGWSANAGSNWVSALAFFNNGTPSADMYLGSSVMAVNAILGNPLPVPTAFGTGGASQLPGFNMTLIPSTIVPEPTSMALAGLGAASLLMFRRRK